VLARGVFEPSVGSRIFSGSFLNHFGPGAPPTASACLSNRLRGHLVVLDPDAAVIITGRVARRIRVAPAEGVGQFRGRPNKDRFLNRRDFLLRQEAFDPKLRGVDGLKLFLLRARAQRGGCHRPQFRGPRARALP